MASPRNGSNADQLVGGIIAQSRHACTPPDRRTIGRPSGPAVAMIELLNGGEVSGFVGLGIEWHDSPYAYLLSGYDRACAGGLAYHVNPIDWSPSATVHPFWTPNCLTYRDFPQRPRISNSSLALQFFFLRQADRRNAKKAGSVAGVFSNLVIFGKTITYSWHLVEISIRQTVWSPERGGRSRTGSVDRFTPGTLPRR